MGKKSKEIPKEVMDAYKRSQKLGELATLQRTQAREEAERKEKAAIEADLKYRKTQATQQRSVMDMERGMTTGKNATKGLMPGKNMTRGLTPGKSMEGEIKPFGKGGAGELGEAWMHGKTRPRRLEVY